MSFRIARFLLLGFALSVLLFTGQADAAARLSQALPAGTLATSLSTIYDWYFSGGAEGVELGYSLHTAGDVNADGYADILIGAPKYILETEREGVVFLFYGSESGLSHEPDWILACGQKGARCGHSVGTAGDVNDDGYDDILIGASDYQVDFGLSGTPKSGAVFVYHGSPAGLAETPAWEIYAEAPEIALGRSVSAAGDVNHDGFADIIVAAPLFSSSPTHTSEGKLYLYLGDSDGLAAVPAWTYECDQATAMCGDSLDAAGDINGDGYDDVIVGATTWDGIFSNEGLALVFYGYPGGLQPEPAWILSGGQVGAQFGRAVAGAGDVNGDTYADILVGAPNFTNDLDAPQAGAAYLFLGSPAGPSLAPVWVTYGEEAYARYGHALHTAGDVDPDGFADVIIGSHLLGTSGDIEHQPDEGAAYIFNGSSAGLDLAPSWTVYGDKADAWFGYSVGSAGDINGDLASDVIIGTPNYKIDERVIMGRGYAYYSQYDGSKYTLFLPLAIAP